MTEPAALLFVCSTALLGVAFLAGAAWASRALEQEKITPSEGRRRDHAAALAAEARAGARRR